jgi:maleylpyruvate isomerase
MGHMSETETDQLREATRRLVRTVDELADDEFDAPSLLPGWTRAHVIAHLALNAEGLGRALAGVAAGEIVPMYDSDEARDRDIEELAAAAPPELRQRLEAATTRFSDGAAALASDHDGLRVHRSPDGPTWPAATTLGKRLREVEIHHVDLDVDYTRHDWPTPFSEDLVTQFTARLRKKADFTVRASDTGRTWVVGTGGEPTVTGSAADLGWWLTGRGAGEGLTSTGGELPAVPPW